MDNIEHSDISRVVEVWTRNHQLRPSSITIYLQWVRRFLSYCDARGLDRDNALTLSGCSKFAKAYARSAGIDQHTAFEGARSALHTYSAALAVLGEAIPQWQEHPTVRRSPSPVVVEFIEFLRNVRGNPESTLHKKTAQIEEFLGFLRGRRRDVRRVRLVDVDVYVLACSKRFARSTVADICSGMRVFLRFLHSSGRLSCDLSSSVASPRYRRGERPLRALPWESVQKILQAVDRSSPIGCRDYVILLMMSAYGLGAGELIRIMLDDVHWRKKELHVVRPKTGVEILLPLMPAVAEALVEYLKHGRPVDAPTRHLIVSATMPYAPLTASSAVRHVLIKHAQTAGVSAPYLGSHVLRHSHACRQMEVGAGAKTIGDILGHRHPASTSAYLRVSTERLRALALEVPQ